MNQPRQRVSTLALLPILAGSFAALTLPGCGDSGSSNLLPTPGPGVIFSYPYDGQRDIPTGARVVVSFTAPVDESALTGCDAFCVMGPSGPVTSTIEIAGPEGNVIQVQPGGLEPGATYEVIARPGLLAGATNLPESGPLVTFHTRQTDILVGQPPAVLTINGDEPSAFISGGVGAQQVFPFLDFSSIRLLLSEPLDDSTVQLGATFEFVEGAGCTDPMQDPGVPVAGNLLVQGIHVSFDPAEDLTPGSQYCLRLHSGIRDRGGEPIVEVGNPPVTFVFQPQDSRTDGALIVQILNTDPAFGDEGFPRISSIAGMAINTIEESSTLIGDATIDVKDVTIRAEMGHTSKFESFKYGPVIPLTIRKGQLVETGALDVALGGVVPVDLQTGDIRVQFASDAFGFLTRNPYRDKQAVPEDSESPVFAFLAFDVSVTSTDDAGNAVLNQTVLNVTAVGTANVADGALAIETVGAMELDLLGVAKAPSNLVLSLKTAPDAAVPADNLTPRMTASYPVDGDGGFPVTDSILLTFSETVDVTRLVDGDIALTTGGGAPVATTLRSQGSTLVVTPNTPLNYGSSYSLTVLNALDFAGNAWAASPDDATGGDGVIEFQTPVLSTDDEAAPLLTAVYPGVPCALVDGDASSPGRCAEGQGEDERYAPFVLPADEHIEAYFSQPIIRSSLTLGQACGAGSVRVEEVDGSGGCIAPVPGTLLTRERGIQFLPSQPWTPGQAYRLVLVPGSNGSCAPGEICGFTDEPLNTDALDGSEGDDSGGPDLVISFTGASASTDQYVPASTVPFVDINGNGFVDGGEIPTEVNRAVALITASSGVAGGAEFQDDCIPETPEKEGCIYLSADMPVSLGSPQTNCTVGLDETGNMITAAECIPVRVFPQIMYGTSLTVDTIVNIDTGRTVMRIRDTPERPIIGYIYEDGGQTVLRVSMQVYMDAPDMRIALGLVGHDLRSKDVTITAVGPVSFLSDGRMQINLTNTNEVNLDTSVDLLGLGLGSMTLQIAPGGMHMQLLSAPLKGAKR